jgi:hypothetical protein
VPSGTPGLPWDTNLNFRSPTIAALSESWSETGTNNAGLTDAVGFCPGKYSHPVLDDLNRLITHRDSLVRASSDRSLSHLKQHSCKLPSIVESLK